MINLIPPEGHASLKREYLLRVGTVYGVLLSGVLFAGVALSIPTYVLISAQVANTTEQGKGTDNISEQFREAEALVRHTNEMALQLAQKHDETRASSRIADITRVASHGIALRTFQISREQEVFSSIQVQGVAASRTALAAFKEALEALPYVASVKVPLSDLARDANLPFAITITFSTTSR